MTFTRLALTIAALLVALNLATAQAPPKLDEPAGQPAGGGSAAGPADQRQMYEDIEIMRRLILTKLDGQSPALRSQLLFTYPDSMNMPGMSGGGMMGTSSGMGGGGMRGGESARLLTGYRSTAPLKSEGVYLKGRGVTYTLTMPPPAQDPRPQSTRPAAKPASDWERTRHQIRGEKTEPADNKEPKQPAVADVVLKLLADNGHNFKLLGENETITVVITFRSEAQTTAGQFSSFWSGEFGSPGATSYGITPPSSNSPALPVYVAVQADPPGTTKVAVRDPKANPSSVGDYELLGDLHQKQGRVQDAIAAYKKAIDMTAETKKTAALYQKLAQAYLAQEDPNRAQDAIKKALTLMADDAKKTEAAAKAPSSLPAKLIISASKKLLDQAGAGKVSLDDFKKSASVDYLTFTSDKKLEEKPAK